MKTISMDEFLLTTWAEGWPPRMNLAVYRGEMYDCICGARHALDPSRVARELQKMHLVVECPGGRGLVCIKIKGIFFTKLITIYGAPDCNDDSEIADSIACNGSENAPIVEQEHKPQAAADCVTVMPAVRMQARKLKVDIDAVRGTGPNGRVTMADLKRHADEAAANEAGIKDKDHELGIRAVCESLVEEGASIEKIIADRDRVPHIIASKNGRLLYFIVVTAQGILPALPGALKHRCEMQAARAGAECMFAPVALRPSGDVDEVGNPGFFVKYEGYRAT